MSRQKDFNDIKQHMQNNDSKINKKEIVKVFDILLRKNLITEQEYQRAVNKVSSQFIK